SARNGNPGEWLAHLPGRLRAELRRGYRWEIYSGTEEDRHRDRQAVERSRPRLSVGVRERSGRLGHFQMFAAQQFARGLWSHRFAEGVTLRVFAAELVKLHGVGIRFSALGDHFHTEIVRQRNDGSKDDGP